MSFYRQPDVVRLSQDLLGKVLCARIDGQLTKAVLTETEAYAGEMDRASHAYGGRRTKRTEPIYRAGGVAYVYLCYGIHHLFNVVTNDAGVPHAVLVRAASPLHGEDVMLARRGRKKVDAKLMAGPGTMAQAMGIRRSMTGDSLAGPGVWIEDHGIVPETITAGPRIGIDYAGEDAALPYRFIAEVNL